MNKGPFSFSGNKTRIWKSHLCDIMINFDRVHEPFIGSGVCVYNSKSGGECIDKDPNVVMLHNALSIPNFDVKVENTYNNYFKNDQTKEKYDKLREEFNIDYIKNGLNFENVDMLYILIQLSFNSLLRFSRNGFNVPYGEKNFDLDRIKKHMSIFSEKEINVSLGDYYDLDLNKINPEVDLVYLDPPYLASKYLYGGWSKENETELLNWIDYINKNGFKFLLSNTFSHRGIENKELMEWSSNYKVKYIDMTYNAWSSRVESVKKEDKTIEVLISNF
jgi:DNA adenine methylase Dam